MHMIYFYLSNKPFLIYFGDYEVMHAWFTFFSEEGYHPVQISSQKAQELMAQGPDEQTQEVWIMRHKTQPPSL